jgi:AcrR family transcriptional regulator
VRGRNSTARTIVDDSMDSNPPVTTERLRRGKTLAERRQERRAALVDAALDLFGTKGYANTTVEEICRAAYVSTRNFYEEFTNREDVLHAVGDRVALAAMQALSGVSVPAGPDQLRRETRARVGALLHVLVDDPRVARFAFIESRGVSPDQESRRRDIHRMIAHWLAEFTAVEGHAVGFTPERLELQALAVVGACNELISDWVLREDRSTTDELADVLVEIILGMLPQGERGPQTGR